MILAYVARFAHGELNIFSERLKVARAVVKIINGGIPWTRQGALRYRKAIARQGGLMSYNKKKKKRKNINIKKRHQSPPWGRRDSRDDVRNYFLNPISPGYSDKTKPLLIIQVSERRRGMVGWRGGSRNYNCRADTRNSPRRVYTCVRNVLPGTCNTFSTTTVRYRVIMFKINRNANDN